MDILSLIKTATLGLRANRLRAILTTLGIIIGVATVISMISIVDGMNRYTYRILGSLGSNAVYIQKWKWRVFSGRMSRKWFKEIAKRKDLTIEDAKAIDGLPSIEAAVPIQPLSGLTASYLDKDVDVGDALGTTSLYVPVSGYEIEKGRNLIEQDNKFKRQVCIIGKFVVDNLFEGEVDPIGKEVQIGKYKFLVVGVLKERGQIMGQSMDNILIMPIKTAQKFFVSKRAGYRKVFGSLYILAKIKEGVPMEKGLNDIEGLLRVRRGLRFDEEDDFAMNTQQALLEAWKKLTRGIFLAMIGIASLALLVGGIGIMNIMLVSVTERTREIGIRMAVGAKRREILLQFLLEAIFLTVAGGSIGVILGFLIAKGVDLATPLPSAMPIWSVVLGLGFSAIVGLFFGIYPASKASKMDPIEALRYE